MMGMYDEELGQTGGNCKSACAAFAEYQARAAFEVKMVSCFQVLASEHVTI